MKPPLIIVVEYCTLKIRVYYDLETACKDLNLPFNELKNKSYPIPTDFYRRIDSVSITEGN